MEKEERRRRRREKWKDGKDKDRIIDDGEIPWCQSVCSYEYASARGRTPPFTPQWPSPPVLTDYPRAVYPPVPPPVLTECCLPPRRLVPPLPPLPYLRTVASFLYWVVCL